MLDESSKRSKKDIILIASAIIVVLLIGFYFLNSPYSDLFYDYEKLRSFIDGFGVYGPLIFISLMIFQIIFAPIPGHVVYLAGGYVFGVAGGMLYGVIGLVVGTFLAVLISRVLGRPFVEKFVSEKNLEKFDEVTYDYGLIAIFVLFLLPGLPDDALCFLAGLTNIDIEKLLGTIVAGRVPGLVAMVFAGEKLANSKWISFIVIIGVVTILSYLALRYRKKIMSFRKNLE